MNQSLTKDTDTSDIEQRLSTNATEVGRRVAALAQLLESYRGPPPRMTTVCRSNRDGYIPRPLATGVEHGVLSLLRRRFGAEAAEIEFDGYLLGGAEGWARHVAMIQCADEQEAGIGSSGPLLATAPHSAAKESCIAAVTEEHRRRVPWEAALQEQEASGGSVVHARSNVEPPQQGGTTTTPIAPRACLGALGLALVFLLARQLRRPPTHGRIDSSSKAV